MDAFTGYPSGFPTITEREAGITKHMDVYTKLMEERIIVIHGPIDTGVASAVTCSLLALEEQNNKKDISIFVMSPGGSVSAGLAIVDIMRFVKPDIRTICSGQAASMGAVILACGAKGKRLITPSSDIMIHEPWSDIGVRTTTDLGIEFDHMNRVKERLIKILAEQTERPEEDVASDCQRNNWMDAEEAVAYGIVDKVIAHNEAEDEEY